MKPTTLPMKAAVFFLSVLVARVALGAGLSVIICLIDYFRCLNVWLSGLFLSPPLIFIFTQQVFFFLLFLFYFSRSGGGDDMPRHNIHCDDCDDCDDHDNCDRGIRWD